jgi:glycosyltransferase involved in cell wall biosynthesis
MRIAQVSPLYERRPPQLYGGTGRVVSYLTEELVRQGHEVTLFASGDSVTNATLRAPCHRALRLDPRCKDPLPHHLVMLNRVARSAKVFDIIHFHADFLHFPLFARLWGKTVTTAHGRLDLPDLQPLFREFPMMPLVSISDAQRAPVPGRAGRALFITASRRIFIFRAAETAATSRLSAASAPRKGWKRRSKLPAAPESR